MVERRFLKIRGDLSVSVSRREVASKYGMIKDVERPNNKVMSIVAKRCGRV